MSGNRTLDGLGRRASSPSAMGDRNYYDFVSDGFERLCAACKIMPCVLDAAICSGFGVAWVRLESPYDPNGNRAV